MARICLIGKEVGVKLVLVDDIVGGDQDPILQVLPGVPGLLPPDVAQGVVEELLLEADHRPPVYTIPNTEGGELRKPSFHDLEYRMFKINGVNNMYLNDLI